MFAIIETISAQQLPAVAAGALTSVPAEASTYLYGSYARGHVHALSDVDVLVVARSSGEKEQLNRWAVGATRVAPQLSITVLTEGELWAEGRVNPSFVAHLHLEGLPLHAGIDGADLQRALYREFTEPELLQAEALRRVRRFERVTLDRSGHRSAVPALARTYEVSKALCMIGNLRRGYPEFRWQHAFTTFAQLHPRMSDEVEMLERLRPFYEANRDGRTLTADERATAPSLLNDCMESVRRIQNG